MADGQISINILANTSQYKQQVQSLGVLTQNALDSVSSKLSSLGSTLTRAVTAPFMVATGAAAKWGIGVASAAEQAEIAFTTMLGSADKAQVMMQNLADFAKRTPFDLAGLTTASQRLLAYGFAAEDVIPVLTAVGNASAGLGSGQQGIEAITRALGQMQAKGKVMAQEMLQLTEAGVPAWQMLADAVSNGDIPQAMDMVTKGSVDAKTALAALQEGMNAKYGGMMEKQALTLTGVLSNMGDAAESAVRKMYKTDAWSNLTKALSGAAEQIEPFVDKLMPSAESLLSFIANRVEALTGFIANLSQQDVTNIVRSLTALAATGPLLTATAKALSVFSGGVDVILKGTSKLSAFTKKSASVLKSFGSTVAKTDAFKKFAVSSSLSLELIKGVAKQDLLSAAQSVSAFARKGAFSLKTFATSAQATLSSGFKTLKTTIKTNASNMWTGFVDGGGVSGAIQRTFKNGASAAKSGISALAASLKGSASAVQTTLTGLPGTLSTTMDAASAALKSAGPKAARALSSVSTAAAGSLKSFHEGIKGSMSQAATLVSSGFDTIKRTLKSTGASLGSAAKTATGSVKSAFATISALFAKGGLPALEKAGWAALGSAVSSGLGTAKAALSNFAAAAKNSLSGLANSTSGFVGSFKGGMQSLASAIKTNLVGAVVGAKTLIAQNMSSIKDGFVSVGKLGVSAGKGIAVGMLGAGAGVAALAATLGGTLLAAASTGADLTALGEGAKQYIDSIGQTILGTISGLSQAVPQVISFLQTQAPTIVAQALAMMQSVLQALVDFLPQLGQVFAAALPVITQALTGMLPMIVEVAILLFSGLIDGLAQAIVALTAALPDIMSGVGSALATYGPTLMSSCQTLFNALIDAFPVVIQQLVAALPGFLQWVANALPGFVGTLFNAAITLFNALAEALPQVIPAVIGALGQLLLNIVTTMPQWVPKFISAMFNLAVSLAKGIGQAVGNIVGAMGELLGKAWEAVQNIDWIDLGRNIINGIIDGIKAIGGGIVDAVCGFASGAIEGAKKLLGIASPSKVFKRIGRWTVEGFALGITDNQASALKAMNNMVNGVIDESGRLSDMSAELDTSINRQVSVATTVSANGVYRSLSDRLDAMSTSIADAITRPVDINYNGREFGRMVREVVPAR